MRALVFGARGLDSLRFLMSVGPLARDFIEGWAHRIFWSSESRWKALGDRIFVTSVSGDLELVRVMGV